MALLRQGPTRRHHLHHSPGRSPARAGLSAARSFEESAVQHERVAKTQDWTVQQGVPEVDMHRASAIKHRQAAAEDRKLAERKRRESAADLASPASASD
ncbi:hypothetical protein [Mycobacterium avium]|nr:hypothetical protein [Mycobacterium avium]